MIVGSNILAGASGQAGYFLNRSVRIRASASAYFNRTPASSGNLTTWTYSCWIKRGALTSAGYTLFGSGGNNTNDCWLQFSASGGVADSLDFMVRDSSTVRCRLTTTQVFRDPSAWYHVVVVWNSTDATSTNRAKLYINGVQVTAFSTATYPAQNTNSLFNAATTLYLNRARADAPDYFDGYETEINFIDGQALTPSSFGEYNTLTGVWQPKKYGGTYGTNGFYLNFNDNSAATAAAIGKDSSGNGNNWTPNNISVTAGVTYDSMTDVPTLTSVTQANYATLSPVTTFASGNSFTVTNGNLTYTQAVCQNSTYCGTTIALPYGSGLFYYEITQTSRTTVGGDATQPFVLFTKDFASTGASYANTVYYLSGAGASTDPTGAALTGVSSISNNDVIMVAIDLVNGKLFLGKNGTWFNSGNPTAGTGAVSTNLANYPVFIPAIGNGGGNMSNFSCSFNFGQRPFSYTQPTNFKALNTYNLPTPTISNGATQFAATTYTGNGSTQNISNAVNGVSFQPDFVWLKGRSAALTNHGLSDSLRTSSGLAYVLYSDLTNAESLGGAYVYAPFNANGFAPTSNNSANQNGATFVGWQWKASNAAAVTNTSGSISSQVSANTTAGFSIVTYTGTGSNATVGHGLGIAPSMIIVKCRNTAATGWLTYVRPLTATSFLQLETTNAVASNITAWNNTAPTSTVFSIGTSAFCNGNTQTYVAYCWSEIAGYSRINSYIGNGSTDGTFVYTGMRPRYLLIKNSTSATAWAIFDTSRNPYNVTNNLLQAQSSGAEASYPEIDILSNGFKIRGTNGTWNTSGNTYIFMAFAENPFRNSLAR